MCGYICICVSFSLHCIILSCIEGDSKGLEVLRGVLHEVMLRRTKGDKDSHGCLALITSSEYSPHSKIPFVSLGQSIIQLPTKTSHIVRVTLSPAEREFYDALLRRSKAVCRNYDAEVNGHLKKNKYAALFTLLLHLRQACDHPFLVFGKTQEGDVASSSATDKEKEKEKAPSSSAMETEKGEHSENEMNDEDGSNVLGKKFLRSILRKLQKSLSSQPPLATSGRASTSPLEDLHSKGSEEDKAEKEKEEDKAVSDEEDRYYECPICYEDIPARQVYISRACGHRFCKTCFGASLTRFKACATCQQPISIESVVQLSTLLSKSDMEIIEVESQAPTSVEEREVEVDWVDSWRTWGDAKFRKKRSMESQSSDGKGGSMPWRDSSKLQVLMDTLKMIFATGIVCGGRPRKRYNTA